MKKTMNRNRLLSSAGWLLLSLLLVIAGCGGEADGPAITSEGTTHPRPEAIPGDDEVADVIEMTSGTSGQSENLGYASRLQHAEKLFTIGVRQGDRYEMIGKVEDVAVGGKGAYLLAGFSLQ